MEDAGIAWTRSLAEEGWVDGFDAEGLGGWAVHEDVWREVDVSWGLVRCEDGGGIETY